ncbi:MAG: hypothetical protein K2X81_28595 [Candidatus Obscuribacterales bacterium]|nr:hypothetical protein [Candidatus Obscuribacterales bacterium]
MKPSKILRVYLSSSCVIGLLFTALTVLLLKRAEIGMGAAFILPMCWNVLLMLVLPVVLDWSEQKYLNARFLQLEDVARDNPELKLYLDQQCQKRAVTNIKLAVVDSNGEETFSYGMMRYNPRVILPSSMLSTDDKSRVIPSIENELDRFARQEISLYFFAFTFIQIALQQIVFRLF